MKNHLKELLKINITDTHLKSFKGLKIHAIPCFWNKCNFSAIITYYGNKYYCYYCNKLSDFVIESA